MSDTTISPAAEAGSGIRQAAFEKRLKQRYASEKRFRLLGLAAVTFSVAVLLILLGTMLYNGAGGLQRAELRVPIDFAEAGLSVDAVTLEQSGVQSLEAQGLPQVVDYFAGEALGEDGAAEVSGEAWRELAARIVADPDLARGEQELWVPASADLAQGM